MVIFILWFFSPYRHVLAQFDSSFHFFYPWGWVMCSPELSNNSTSSHNSLEASSSLRIFIFILILLLSKSLHHPTFIHCKNFWLLTYFPKVLTILQERLLIKSRKLQYLTPVGTQTFSLSLYHLAFF